MAVATVENGSGLGGVIDAGGSTRRFGERITVRRDLGVFAILVFAVIVAGIGISAGAALLGLGLAALLVVGSTLVAAEGEPLAARSAALMGTIHVVAITLLTL